MKQIFLTLAAFAMAATAIAQPKGNMMVIDASAEGIPVQSTMYGLFFRRY